MKRITIEELKEIQVNILKDISNYCEMNNIKYFMIAGTLIGAVRHKGFIPWDDDIDIAMPRPDYERFLKGYLSQHYKAIDHRNWDRYYYPFAKVIDTRTSLDEKKNHMSKIGCYVDIFPIDAISSEENFDSLRFKTITFFTRILSLKLFINPNMPKFKKTFLKALAVPFTLSWTRDMIIKLSSMYDYENVDRVGMLVWGYGIEKQSFEKYVYDETIKLQFENVMFSALKNYDIYLSKIYGDYMTPPPLNEQKTTHFIEAYWK